MTFPRIGRRNAAIAAVGSALAIGAIAGGALFHDAFQTSPASAQSQHIVVDALPVEWPAERYVPMPEPVPFDPATDAVFADMDVSLGDGAVVVDDMPVDDFRGLVYTGNPPPEPMPR